MEGIFQKIWNADMSGNGVPAVRSDELRDENTGYVLVDERSAQVGTSHKVFAEVVIPIAKRRSYELCQRILDNYALERSATEFIRPDEQQEELDFIDAILPTPPIQVAKSYMERSLGLTISNESLASMIHETWFKFGSAGSQRDATGFEHVFVGEQGGSSSKIGGYHYWYKYHLDDAGRQFDGVEGIDRIEYRGTQYGGAETPDNGVLIPEVVTLSLVWSAPSGDGGSSKILEKPVGGFFVGLSPEGLIALGLVRCRTSSGKIAHINGAEYQLDLHRLDNEPNSIRTFFPRFVRADVVSIIDPPVTPIAPAPTDVIKSMKIILGMVNPQNPEGGREFVQICNVSSQVSSLKGWKIVAPNGKQYQLADIEISAGDIYKFTLPTSQGELRNSGGDIRLLNPANQTVQTASYTQDQASQEGVPVLF